MPWRATNTSPSPTGRFPNADRMNSPWAPAIICTVPVLTETRMSSSKSELADIACRVIDRVFRAANDLVDFRFARNERGRQHHRVTDGAHDEPIRKAVVPAACAHILIAREESPLALVRNQF